MMREGLSVHADTQKRSGLINLGFKSVLTVGVNHIQTKTSC